MEFTLQLTKGFDSKLGGFGLPPKFPRPVEIAVMLQRYKRLDQSGKETAANKALDMALSSLRCMARGGVHDHVGGGFHRYSVDEYWHGSVSYLLSGLTASVLQAYEIVVMPRKVG